MPSYERDASFRRDGSMEPTKPGWGMLGVSREEPRDDGVETPRTDSMPMWSMLVNHSVELWP